MSVFNEDLFQGLKTWAESHGSAEPVIPDDDISVGDIKALLGEIDRLTKERQRLVLDHLSSEGQWIEHTGKLNAEIEKLKAGQFDVLLDIAKQRDQCQAESRKSKAELKEFKSFVEEIRDGYDCDTGANGVHAYRCRCCVAGDLLGEPPSVYDPRTRGG